jgi:hypothetical protein
MMQKSTSFTTIFRVKKCYFHYDFSCKKVPLSLRNAKNEFFNTVTVYFLIKEPQLVDLGLYSGRQKKLAII